VRSLRLERTFPKLLAAGYDITSPDTSSLSTTYNCIAWAAHDTRHGFWWPHEYGHWPLRLRREATVDCFIRAFRFLGYQKCNHSRPEFACEKVALYAIGGVPKHMARQLADGTWTSKLGDWEDITHYTLDALESYGPWPLGEYGTPAIFMKRLIPVGWCVRATQFAVWKIESVLQRAKTSGHFVA
jgi:transposase